MRLKKSPATAVIAIISELTFCGLMILLVASTTNQRVSVTKKETLISVPRISALCHPKVSSWEAGLILILSAIMDILKPIMSEARCAVSVKIAIELARYPPVIWAAIKNIETNETIFSFLIAF